VLFDVDMEWIRSVRKFIKEFPKVYDEVDRLLTKNRIFVDRTKGIGYLSKEDAINLSASGPVARASGVERDLRRDEPYLAYEDLDFNVVCSKSGDCYARYLVRMQELLESLKIIEQAVENIPGGPVNIAVDSDMVLPAKPSVYRSIEGLIQHFEVIMPNKGYEVPREQVYAATESPNGELGFFIVGNAETRAYRARTRPPSFIHFSMFPHMIKDHQLSDVVAVLGSINIIAAELDR
jgi:NADH-quinone oxidoreductase subunit D